jgi:macrodomain Ter protein organizer (MatP/YcbG family)
MSAELDNKLKQAIRAKRKRHYNAEQVHTKKKSIDLDYRVWEKLSYRANELGCTLSEAIEYLLSEASRSEKATKTVSSLKEDLSKLLSD